MRLQTFLALALVGFMASPVSAATKKKKTGKTVKSPKMEAVQAAPGSTPQASESSAIVPPSAPNQSGPSQPVTTARPGVYNEADVLHLDGTIMVQHSDNTVSALQTGSTLEKGDVLFIYDGSWVILKTHRGDQIGLDGGSILSFDEYYIEGPDRQIRFNLKQGTLYLKTNDSNSKQSFFEIHAGDQMASIGDFRGIISFNPKSGQFKTQYLSGKLKVLDKDGETTVSVEGSEYLWENGKAMQTAPVLMDEIVAVNFTRFFNEEDLLGDAVNNILLSDSLLGQAILSFSGSKKVDQVQQAKDLYHGGEDAYRRGEFKAARDFWEQALALEPHYRAVQSRLEKLAEEHPELKIDENLWRQRPGYDPGPVKKP